MTAFRGFPVLSAVGLLLAQASAQAANHPINLPSSTTANGTLPSSTTANCTEIPPGGGNPVCFLITNTNTTLSDVYAIGGVANSSNGTGVNWHSDNGTGVYGVSVIGTGVHGLSQGHVGVFGESFGDNGVQGHSATATSSGVYGYNDSTGGFGTAGRMTGAGNNGMAIYGNNDSSNGWAGYFDGQVKVTASGSVIARSYTRRALYSSERSATCAESRFSIT